MVMENAKRVELNTKNVSAVLNTQTLKTIKYTYVCVVTAITKNV